MEDNRSRHQLIQDNQRQAHRWPILAQHYFKASSLVASEGWPVLEEELRRHREMYLELLARPEAQERESDQCRGALELLNKLLHLAEDVKDFPK